MTGALLEAFRHHAWATKTLIGACASLSESQVGASATGGYGDILATFNHLVLADGGYLRRLGGDVPAWVVDRIDADDIAALEPRVAEISPLWERLVAGPLDADRMLILDEGTYEAVAGVVVVQALNHGNVHREQICAILTSLGIEPPEIDAWAYGEANGRGRPTAKD